MRQIRLRNAQRRAKLHVKAIRALLRNLLDDALALRCYEVSVIFVSPRRMSAINEQFLNHRGSTDVITFDYRSGYDDAAVEQCDLAGEIYISVADAMAQAGEFKTTWQEEIARYIIHGVLHLLGFDDLEQDARRKMKREENRLVRALARAVPSHTLGD